MNFCSPSYTLNSGLHLPTRSPDKLLTKVSSLSRHQNNCVCCIHMHKASTVLNTTRAWLLQTAVTYWATWTPSKTEFSSSSRINYVCSSQLFFFSCRAMSNSLKASKSFPQQVLIKSANYFACALELLALFSPSEN